MLVKKTSRTWNILIDKSYKGIEGVTMCINILNDIISCRPVAYFNIYLHTK